MIYPFCRFDISILLSIKIFQNSVKLHVKKLRPWKLFTSMWLLQGRNQMIMTFALKLIFVLKKSEESNFKWSTQRWIHREIILDTYSLISNNGNKNHSRIFVHYFSVGMSCIVLSGFEILAAWISSGLMPINLRHF